MGKHRDIPTPTLTDLSLIVYNTHEFRERTVDYSLDAKSLVFML